MAIGRRRIRYKAVRIRTRHHKKKIGLFDIVGLAMGLGLSAFGPNGSNFQYFKEDPVGQTKFALNGMIAGITGYDMIKKNWDVKNLGEFWVPFLSFAFADYILKKLGFHRVKITRDISLA